jgi:polyribonucleotide nucleotidyltransferase
MHLNLVEKDVVRKSILSNEPRIDGRDLDTVRPIFVETNVCQVFMDLLCLLEVKLKH